MKLSYKITAPGLRAVIAELQYRREVYLKQKEDSVNNRFILKGLIELLDKLAIIWIKKGNSNKLFTVNFSNSECYVYFISYQKDPVDPYTLNEVQCLRSACHKELMRFPLLLP